MQFALQHRHLLTHHPAGDYWIVVLRGRRVGRLYVDRSTPTWRLAEFALLPQARGKGIGSALIAWLQGAAKAAGADIDLHVAHGNPRAARLYARSGFAAAIDATPSHRRMVWRPS